MIEFKELKTDVFIKKPTCSQLLYLFTDALRFLDMHNETNPSVSRLDCEICSESFIVRFRACGDDGYKSFTFPVHWFACQGFAFHQIRPDACYKIEIEPHFDSHFYLDVKYKLFMDLPF